MSYFFTNNFLNTLQSSYPKINTIKKYTCKIPLLINNKHKKYNKEKVKENNKELTTLIKKLLLNTNLYNNSKKR